MMNKTLKTMFLGLTLTLGSLTAHAEKTRQEAIDEAVAKINERYDVKEAKNVIKARQKLEAKQLKIKQKRELLEAELAKTAK